MQLLLISVKLKSPIQYITHNINTLAIWQYNGIFLFQTPMTNAMINMPPHFSVNLYHCNYSICQTLTDLDSLRIIIPDNCQTQLAYTVAVLSVSPILIIRNKSWKWDRVGAECRDVWDFERTNDHKHEGGVHYIPYIQTCMLLWLTLYETHQ